MTSDSKCTRNVFQKGLSLLWVCIFLQTACITRPCDLSAIYQSSPQVCKEEICPPASPPGTADFVHKSVETLNLEEGFFDDFRSVIYLPQEPAPERAPVILYLHGYFDSEPKPYDAMLRHFARKGYIVIYPSYGNPLNPKAWLSNAEEALKRALAHLEKSGPVRPDTQRLAIVGHSIGGLLALNMAQKKGVKPETGIPEVRLLVLTDAAGISTPAYPPLSIADLSGIPASTHLLLLMAEESYRGRFEAQGHCEKEDGTQKTDGPCNVFAVNRLAFQKTTAVPAKNKAAILIQSDMRTKEALRSEHNGAQGYCGLPAKPIDAIDTWGYWRFTLAALDQVLKGKNSEGAFLKAEVLRSSGIWSDGQAVKPALSFDSCLQSAECPALR